MKTLLLLRHAKSSWKDDSNSDFDRPLNERGKHDAPLVGDRLREKGLIPDLVLSSSAKRARKTAEKVIEASGDDVELRLLEELYLAIPTTYMTHLSRLPDELRCVMVVGHNPGLEELSSELTGQHAHLATATLVHIELPIERWNELARNRSATLVSVWQPPSDE